MGWENIFNRNILDCAKYYPYGGYFDNLSGYNNYGSSGNYYNFIFPTRYNFIGNANNNTKNFDYLANQNFLMPTYYNPFASRNLFPVDNNLLKSCLMLNSTSPIWLGNNLLYKFQQEANLKSKSVATEAKETPETSKTKKTDKITLPKLELKKTEHSRIGFDTFERSTNSSLLSLKDNLVNGALSYKGVINSQKDGNDLFSPNAKKQAYCADFLTYNVKKAYGSKLPSDIGTAYDPGSKGYLGTSSVRGWQLWAKNNNCYIDTTNKADKNTFIANNVKRGDIMIEKENGKSHTGIVTEVYTDSNGVTWFETIEGNVSSNHKVDTRKYRADSKTLSGFINLDKYLA